MIPACSERDQGGGERAGASEFAGAASVRESGIPACSERDQGMA
jgi:hypothetical protein